MEDQRKRSTGMLSHVRKLSVDIGARPSASSAEEAAARYVEHALKRDDLAPAYERFRARRNPSTPLAVCYAVMLSSVLFFRASPIAFTIFFLLGLLAMLLEFMGKSALGVLQWRFPSGNVVARIRPYEREERRVVVLAHLDSHRRAFYYGKRLFWLYRPFIVFHTLTTLLLAMWLIVITGATILKVEDATLVTFWRVALAAAVPLLIAFLAVLSRCLIRRYPKGANDDASGVAVLLNLAHHYSNRRPSSTELWLVALGCEDPGAMGLKRFISQHRAELKGASWIFLEGMGGEKPKCFRKEGLVLPFHANRSLLRTAQDINLVYPHYGLVLGRTDATLGSGYRLLSQGRKAVTFSSRPGSQDAAARDQYDEVDPRNLQANYAFILHYVENIDKKGLARHKRATKPPRSPRPSRPGKSPGPDQAPPSS
jgi:hypothetical protein